MLIPQQACDRRVRQGRRSVTFAQLRKELASPSELLSDEQRQRLLELAKRLERIKALGDEYDRVDFSEAATAALNPAHV